MNKIILALLLTSCTTTDPSPAAAPTPDVAWVCHTTATCAGVDQVEARPLCAAPDTGDVVIPGDQAASDWERLWTAECNVNQGVMTDESVDPNTHPGYCPSTWGCRAACQPTFDACTR